MNVNVKSITLQMTTHAFWVCKSTHIRVGNYDNIHFMVWPRVLSLPLPRYVVRGD